MEFIQLQAFLSVAEKRSFSAAANALSITQPAVSKRIQALEEQLKRPLFDRMAKGATLTPAGHALLSPARRVLAEVANCKAELRSLDGKVSGSLTLGTSHHIGLRHLPTLLRHYINTYPEVQVDLQLSQSEDAFARVIDNQLELAVITLPTTPTAGVVAVCLWPDPLVFSASHDHPLAEQRQVTPAELVQHTALLPTPGTATRRLLEEQLQPHAQSLGQVLETNYLETNKGLAEAGLGWALLPASMLGDKLKALPVTGLKLCRELGVVRREGRTLSTAALAMLAMLHQPPSDKITQ